MLQATILLQDEMFVSMQLTCGRYCDHQLRDVLAVATGLRPLRQREKNAIAGKKTAAATRADEWDLTTGRPPTKTSEHHLNERHTPNGGSAVSSTRHQDGKQSPNETEIEQKAIRDQIRDHGLKPGSVVQVYNDLNSDEWLLSFYAIDLCNLLMMRTGT